MKRAIASVMLAAASCAMTLAYAGDLQKLGDGAAAIGGILGLLSGKGLPAATGSGSSGTKVVTVAAGGSGEVTDMTKAIRFHAGIVANERRLIVAAEAIGDGQRRAWACDILVQQGSNQALVEPNKFTVQNQPANRALITPVSAQHECINQFHGMVATQVQLPFWFDSSKPLTVIWPFAKATFVLN